MKHVILSLALVGLAACGGSTTTGNGNDLPGLANPDATGIEVAGQDVSYGDENRTDADATQDLTGADPLPLPDPLQYGDEAVTPTDNPVTTDEGVKPADLPKDTTPLDTPKEAATDTPLADPVQTDVDGDASLGGCDPCGVGDVNGMTCAPNAKMAVPYVKVWVETFDCNGNPVHIQTYSDAKGSYTLKNIPCGTQTIYMQKGSFQHQWNRFIDQGMTTTLSSGEGCFAGTAAKIAVITGDWDQIENTLKKLYLKYTMISGTGGQSGGESATAISFLTDSSKLNSYDVVFIDCTWAGWPDMQSSSAGTIKANLKAFVAKGGSVYASDYGLPYLSETWPGYILGGGWSAAGNSSYLTNVVDADLAGYMGKTQVTIKYGLGPLTCVSGIGAETTLFLNSTKAIDGCDGTQMMMSFQPEGTTGGKVIYTTFHNDEQPTTATDMETILEYTVFLM